MDECKALPVAAAMTVQTGNRLENMSLNLVKAEGEVTAAARTVTAPPREREPRVWRVGVFARSAVVMSARPMRTEPEAEEAEAETETPPRAEDPPARDKVAFAVALLEEAVGRAAARGPDSAGAAKEAARAVILRGSLGGREQRGGDAFACVCGEYPALRRSPCINPTP